MPNGPIVDGHGEWAAIPIRTLKFRREPGAPCAPGRRRDAGPDGESTLRTGAAAGAPGRPPDLATLLKKAEDEAAELKDAWLRAKAETDNVRKQAQNDVAKAHKYAIERFAQELLPVKDALERRSRRRKRLRRSAARTASS